MKKILITHADPAEAENLRKILLAGGYDAQISANNKTRTDKNADADMILICKNSGVAAFSHGGLSIDFPARKVVSHGREVHLTPIEFQIVTLLAKNHGVVLTHEQIIGEIWGEFNSDSLLLRVNIANIRKKIEPTPAKPVYLLTEPGVGYYFSA